MKRRVLIIDNSVGITGAFKAILSAANGLRSTHEFYFAIPPASKILRDLLNINGHSVLLVNFLELRKSFSLLLYLPTLVINGVRLLKFCQKERISIVHVNDLYNMLGLLIKFLRPSSKLIYHVRLLSTSYGKSMYWLWVKLINWKADKVIVVSKAVREDITNIVNPSKVKLIYDFIVLEERYDIESKCDSAVKFLYLANYTKGKGHEFAIRAFAKATSIDNRIRLTFVGGDFKRTDNASFKRHLQSDVAIGALSEFIIFEDISEDVEKTIKMHDVVLNFSESESFSMTCYEAIYYGRPVIATRSGGPSELIEHEVTGLLVPNRDVPAMTKAILDLSSDEGRRRFFAVKGKISLKEKREAHDPIEEIRQVYDALN